PPEWLSALREQLAEHLVSGPADRGHGGDAEPLVDLGPARVVDPRGYPVHAERLAGHPGGDDVGVVTAADRGEGVRALDARLDKHGPVKAHAGNTIALERRAKPAECLRVPVDDRDGVVPVLQDVSKRRPDPSAAHDHDVHDRPSTMNGIPEQGAPRQRYALACENATP